MRDEHINHAFLDSVLAGHQVDVYYHLGITSDDPIVAELGGLRAVVLAGSGERILDLTRRWSARGADAPVLALPKEERFVSRYCAGVLFVSHGMGMPSASIALQELMRLVYVAKGGDLEQLADVFWARVGTSGGVGLAAGSVVVSTEGVMPDLKPFRLLQGGRGEYWFDGRFPRDIASDLRAAGAGGGFPVELGRTVAANEFFLEQHRLDGAICLDTDATKRAWLDWIRAEGVRNIEMEGAMFAGYLNHWGFPRFAMVCVTLLDRLEGDQVTATPGQLRSFAERPGELVLSHLTLTRG